MNKLAKDFGEMIKESDREINAIKEKKARLLDEITQEMKEAES
jgi:hypothetical protein